MYIESVWDSSPIIHDTDKFVQRRGDEKMHQFYVRFTSLQDVQDFVNYASRESQRITARFFLSATAVTEQVLTI